MCFALMRKPFPALSIVVDKSASSCMFSVGLKPVYFFVLLNVFSYVLGVCARG